MVQKTDKMSLKLGLAIDKTGETTRYFIGYPILLYFTVKLQHEKIEKARIEGNSR